MSFQEKINPMIASIRNDLERIEMHSTSDELGGPDYDTISGITDLTEESLSDIRKLVEAAVVEDPPR